VQTAVLEVYQLALFPSCGRTRLCHYDAHRAGCHRRHQAWRRHRPGVRAAAVHRRDEQDSAVGLRAAARWLDALHLAAEHIADPQLVASLDQSGDVLLNGLTGEPGWPTLRGHLLFWPAPGADPVAELLTAVALPPSSMDRCGDRGTCELASWKALKLFPESIQDWLFSCNRSLLGVEGPAGHHE
jgi:hypothetical protein